MPEIFPVTNAGVEELTWSGATWVGQIDERDMVGTHLDLVSGDQFLRARLLVWSDDQPRGFIEVPVQDGSVAVATIAAAIEDLRPVPRRETDWNMPPISVAVCTRDRPEQLRDVLEDLSLLDYPEFELIVVDNNPDSGLTPPVVETFGGRAVRLVNAASAGLSIARNVAVQNARHDIVAFTDDDVVVDRHWLRYLAYGFTRAERVACVCGMVPSAELVTPAQSYFDRRVGWASASDPAVYDLAAPPAGDPLFPMRVSQFGTGANFAVRKDVIQEVGGFDEGMGVGSPTGGGEDIDMFVRILLARHLLVREPSAVVWHRHRRTPNQLEVQVHNYGLGLGAWIAKLLTHRSTLGMVLRRAFPAVGHLRRVMIVDQRGSATADPEMEALYGRELRGVLSGPTALARSRLAARRGKPLKPPSKVMKRFDFRGNDDWESSRNSVSAGRFAIAAIALGLVGAVGLIQTLPTPVLAITVGGFMLAGPGTLALSWYPELPSSTRFPLIPAVSLSICILVVLGLLLAGIYQPLAVLGGLAAATIAGGLGRCVYLTREVSGGRHRDRDR